MVNMLGNIWEYMGIYGNMMEYDRIWDFVSNFVPIQKSKFGMFEE